MIFSACFRNVSGVGLIAVLLFVQPSNAASQTDSPPNFIAVPGVPPATESDSLSSPLSSSPSSSTIMSARTRFWIGPQIGEQVISSVSNRDQSLHPNYGLAFGIEVPRASGTLGFTFDYNDQRDTSSAGNITISRERIALGVNAQFAPSFLMGTNWMFYGMLGFEYFQDQVQTTLAVQSSLDYGTWQPIGRAGFGFWYTVFDSLRAGAEFRILDSAMINPPVTEEFVLRLAYLW